MKRVVCYCRVSTEEEKQLNALQKQIEELELFVNNKIDWQLIDTYVDEGKSGTTTKGRPSYQKLYADLLTDKFDIVLIKDQSRLMRNVLDWYQFLDRLMKSNKQLYLYLDNCYYTPNDKFITGIKAMMAEEYSRDLSKRISSAALRSQKNGTVYGNSCMLGYKQVGGKFVIIPEEAEIVKQIFEWYANGDGFRKILIRLKEMNVTSTTGTNFSATTLKRMLKNEKYKGLLISHKTSHNFETKKTNKNNQEDYIVIPNGVPAIVSEELWNKCDELRKSRQKKYQKTKQGKENISNQEFYNRYQGQYLLSGKLICGMCGKTMWHDNAYGQSQYVGNKGIDVAKWTCRSYRMYGTDTKIGGCKSVRIYNKEIIECLKKVIFEITSDQSKESISQTIVILKSVLQENDNTKEIDNIKKQINQLKIKSNKLLDILLDGTIDKVTYNNKKDELDSKIQSLNTKLSDLINQGNEQSNKETRLRQIENFLNTIYESPENIPEEMIGNILNNITIFSNEKDNQFMHTAKIVLNLTDKIGSEDDSPIQIYETTYPFIKQGCRKTKEDWQILVYAN